MLSLPDWYSPLGPHRLGNSITVTPRFPLRAKNDPSVEAMILSTVNTCGDVDTKVWNKQNKLKYKECKINICILFCKKTSADQRDILAII